jgi:dUTP pyrophosphatase
MSDSPQQKKRKMSITDSLDTPAPSLLIKRLSEKAKLPTRGSALAAGYDLYRYATTRLICRTYSYNYGSPFSAESKVIPAHGKALIDTQLSLAVPPGTYGRVAPRSGLGLSKPLIHLS